jgi:hypothetical protein
MSGLYSQGLGLYPDTRIPCVPQYLTCFMNLILQNMHSKVAMNVTKYRPNEYGSFYISCPLNILIGFGMSSRCKFNSVMFHCLHCYLCVSVLTVFCDAVVVQYCVFALYVCCIHYECIYCGVFPPGGNC